MYCKHCGNQIDEQARFCPHCGTNMSVNNSSSGGDVPNALFAVLGFFVPLAGLILYLIYESKLPKRAKAAGKGALIGFITHVVLCIVCVVLAIAGTFAFLGNFTDYVSDFGASIFSQKDNDDILEKYAKVTFGEFDIVNDGYYNDTSLEVTVKNISDKRYTFHITIEAIDENGSRLKTDTVYVDKLNAGQAITLRAFEFVEKDQIDDFKNATFKVLDIRYYSF